MASIHTAFLTGKPSTTAWTSHATQRPTPSSNLGGANRPTCVAARSNGVPEGPYCSLQSKPLFSNNTLAKNASATRDVAASSQNEFAARNDAALAVPGGGIAINQKTVDRFLNLGVLGAGGALLMTAAINSGTSPWEAYQHAVAMNPLETKACISGLVYSLGDIIAQSYEGRDVSEWDRGRVVRSGLCGLLAHGPLSHLYYVGLDHTFATQTLIPTDSWLVPLVKIGIDQTVWSLLWNSSYYILLGLLKMESPQVIAATVKSTYWDLLKAGWRMWPLVHVFTYGVIPVQHRLLFVDAVELVWVSILSVYGQQKRDEAAAESDGSAPTWVACALPGADGEGGDAAEEILRGIQVQGEVVFENAVGERVVLTPAEAYAGEPLSTEVRVTSGSGGGGVQN